VLNRAVLIHPSSLIPHPFFPTLVPLAAT